MTTPAQLLTWSERILDSLSETGIAAASVVTWFQNSLYKLNLALGSGFYTESGNILPDMSPNISGIYEEIYYCYYLNRKATQNLGAGAWDWTEIAEDNQGRIRKVSRNEIAKSYQAQAKDCKQTLEELIEWFQQGEGHTLVGTILYGDRGQVADHGLIGYHDPPTTVRSPYNTVWNRTDY
jgi:hypothetical protein